MKHWLRTTTEPATTVQVLSADLADGIRPLLQAGTPPAARGIYLATGDAGIATTVDFWSAALAESPRFASPADFPWTLANAPAGLLARELAIRGPAYTLVGGADATIAAIEHASDDLADHRIDEAVVVALDLAAPPPLLQGAAVVLNAPCRNLPDAVPDGPSATGFLTDLCHGLRLPGGAKTTEGSTR